MKLRREVMCGYKAHWAWGLAYWRVTHDVAVLYPIPLNVIIRIARWVYFKLMHGLVNDPFEDVMAERISSERHKAYKLGYEEGKSEGYAERGNAFNKTMDDVMNERRQQALDAISKAYYDKQRDIT